MGKGDGMTRRFSMSNEETWYWDFPTVDSVLDVLEMERPGDAGSSSTDSHNGDSWDLGIGWNGALDAYTGGWAEGAKRAYDMAEKLKPRPKSSRTTLERSVTGAFPNVGAHLAGAPNAMYRVTKKQVQGHPFVHLYVPIGYSGNVDANRAFDRGCAIVALIDALETAGCRIRVTLCRTSMMNARYRLCMRFSVKGYGDRLDVDQLIFTAAHPAMFRRLCFGLQERSERQTVRNATMGGYGSPVDIEPGDHEPDGKAITVQIAHLHSSRARTPEEFLAEMVRALPEELQTEIGE